MGFWDGKLGDFLEIWTFFYLAMEYRERVYSLLSIWDGFIIDPMRGVVIDFTVQNNPTESETRNLFHTLIVYIPSQNVLQRE